MEFKVFAKKLKNVIGGKSNTKLFTKTIFETMMNESGPELLAGTSLETFKSYFNGNTSISKVAALILANLNEDDEFPSYLEGFGETTAQLLADEFKDDIPDINSVNASLKITDLFLEILREAAGKEKSTPKSADKTPHDILEEKMLASGQAVANAWGNAVSNLVNGLDGNNAAGTTSVPLPEVQENESPYSSEDNLLLQKLIHFAEEYPNATCYWIQIIAKRSIDELWEGSFNGKHYAHPRVRKISADRFYALVTGIPDAFYQLCAVLPQATKDYLDSLNNNSQGKTESASVYSELNTKAQQNGKTLIEQIMADNFETYTGFNQ